MSLDVVVRGFRLGAPRPLASATFHAVFAPHVDQREPTYHYWHVRAADGGEADLYADMDGELCHSLTLNHFTGGAVLDLVIEFARLADAVIMPAGRPALLVAPGQREHLPPAMREDATVVSTAQEVTAAIRAA